MSRSVLHGAHTDQRWFETRRKQSESSARNVNANRQKRSATKFKKFAGDYAFEHRTSSPGYSQSNGKSEYAVKTAKLIMEKAVAAGADPYLGFLDFRNTPTEGFNSSPAQCLFGRRTKTLIPTSSRLLTTKPAGSGTKRKPVERKRKQMFYYNRTAKSLKPLEAGDVVFVRPVGRWKELKRATVNKAVGIRSYVVTTDQGNKIRRNRRHLRLARNEQRLQKTVGVEDIEVHISQPKPSITNSNQIGQPDQIR